MTAASHSLEQSPWRPAPMSGEPVGSGAAKVADAALDWKSAPRLTLLPLLLIGACGEMTPAEEARMDAELACLAKASDLFPQLREGPPSEAAESESSSEGQRHSFRIVDTGQFVMEMELGARPAEVAQRLSCTGDINKRLLTSLEYNGTITRPPAGATWSF